MNVGGWGPGSTLQFVIPMLYGSALDECHPVNQGLRTVDRRSVLFRDLGKFVLGYKKGLREENTPAHDHTRPHHYVHTHP